MKQAKRLSDPKRVAYALFGIASNNVVSTPWLAVMMGIDATFHFYIVIAQILQQLTTTTDTLTVDLVDQYVSFTATYGGSSLIAQAAILFFLLSVATSVAVLAMKSHSQKHAHDLAGLKKLLSFMFISLLTFLQIPLFEIIISNLMCQMLGYGEDNDSQLIRALTMLLACTNTILLLAGIYFIQKLYIVRIPCTKKSWAASSSQLQIMKTINRLLLVISHLYTVANGNNPLYLVLATQIMFTVVALSRDLFVPYYNKLVEWMTRIIEVTSASLIVLQVITSLNSSNFKVNTQQATTLYVTVSLAIIPGLFGLNYLISVFRKKQVWDKLETSLLKNELENEHALYLLRETLGDAFSNNEKISMSARSDLHYLIEVHNRQCFNPECMCHRKDLIKYIMNKSYHQSQGTLILDQSEESLMKCSGASDYFQITSTHLGIKSLTSSQFKDSTSTQSNAAQRNYNDQSSEDKQLKIQVNVLRLRVSFFNKFLECYYDEAKRKFPNSLNIYYQQLAFSLQCCKNRYMTETLLRTFNALYQHLNVKRSWFDQVSIRFNEHHVLTEVIKLQDTNQNRLSEELTMGASKYGFALLTNAKTVRKHSQNLLQRYTELDSYTLATQPHNIMQSQLYTYDPEQFIMNCQLSEQFYQQSALLAQYVQNYWNYISSSQLVVPLIQNQSIKIAETINRVYKVFDKIQGNSDSDGHSSSKYMDQRVCYMFALLQKLLFNDNVQFTLYFEKLNRQREMQRLLSNNMLSSSIQSAQDVGFFLSQGENKDFGSIIIANQSLCKRLGYTADELIHLNILDLMPTLVKQWHPSNVAEFNMNSGETAGMINRDTFTFLRQKNGYMLPVILNTRFHFSQQYEFTFGCFVSAMSEMQVLQTPGASKNQSEEVLFLICEDEEWRVLDISESFFTKLGVSLKKLQNSIETIGSSLTVEDLVPTLTLQKLKMLNADSISMSENRREGVNTIPEKVEINTKMLHRLIGIHSTEQRPILAKCQIFKERYGVYYDKCMNIVALILIDDQSVLEQALYQHQNKKHEHNRSASQLQQINLVSIDQTDGQELEFENVESMSGTESTASTDPMSETSVLKQMFSSTTKKTSKSLTIITQLLFLVFILLMVLSTLNLVLSDNNYVKLQNDVVTVRDSYERITIQSDIRFLIRGLLIQANGFGLPTLPQRIARFNLFAADLDTKLLKLQNVQSNLDQSNFAYSNEFLAMLSTKNVEIQNLDEYNSLQIQNQTFSVAMNLLISRIALILTWPMDNFAGNLSVQTIHETPLPSNYVPTENERTIYFLVMTALGNIRQIGAQITNQYRVEAENNADNVSQITFITIIVSIISVVIVSLIISPILFRVELQKYKGLQFFFGVEVSHIQIVEKQAQQFMTLAYNDLAIQQENNQAQQARRNQHDSNTKHQKRLEDDSINESDVSHNSSGGNLIGPNEIKSADFTFSKILSSMAVKSPGKSAEASDKAAKRSDQVVNRFSESKKRGPLDEINEEEAKEDESEEGPVDEEANNLQNRNDKIVQIQQYAKLQMIKTVIVTVMIALSLSSYFIAAIFFSVTPFQEASSILSYLDLVFMRNSNFQNAVAFIRDDIFLNQSTPAVEDPTQAGADYFLNAWQQSDQEYQLMRKSIPDVFSSISWYFSAIETNQSCIIAFESSPNASSQIPTCEADYNGLLLQGLSDTMELFYRDQKITRMDFIEQEHTYDYLVSCIDNQNIASINGMKQNAVDVILQQVDDMVTQATVNYFVSLPQQYKILYTVFIILMILLFIAFMVLMFKRIRDSMWKTNLTLKILPLEQLSKDNIHELKTFSNY